jgi:predicted ABC-type transport system involved in lysophospholipase L1 biosynthesis ATPase subunit
MLVTHEQALAGAADRRIALQAGRLVADDLPS